MRSPLTQHKVILFFVTLCFLECVMAVFCDGISATRGCCRKYDRPCVWQGLKNIHTMRLFMSSSQPRALDLMSCYLLQQFRLTIRETSENTTAPYAEGRHRRVSNDRSRGMRQRIGFVCRRKREARSAVPPVLPCVPRRVSCRVRDLPGLPTPFV